MIALSEASPQVPPSASASDIRRMTEAARLTGCQVYYIPQDFSRCETAENALAYVPAQEQETPCVWIGYIPTADRYQAMYAAALGKNIRLLNDPGQHLDAQEFDRAYAKLGSLTPASVMITSEDECDAAVAHLGLPVFVKGVVQSRKSRGWKACVAESADELRLLCRHLLSLEGRSRGRVVVRKLAKLRHCRTSAGDFPLGREYRVFLLHGQVLGWGYYWEGDDPLRELSADEKQTVLSLAAEAASRVGTPYICVDIGQMEDGEWIVIETGDAQFSGVSQVSLLPLWSRLGKRKASWVESAWRRLGMGNKKIFVWKELEIHQGDVVALLAIAADEEEARKLVAHRLQENFGLGEEDASALLSQEPDLWHTDTEPVFEL